MKLKDLSKKPALKEVVLDDEDTVKEFGEPLTFHTWDRVPLDIFTRLAAADSTNVASMIDVVRQLVLDEKGHEVIAKDHMLPPNILIRAIAKIVGQLGN